MNIPTDALGWSIVMEIAADPNNPGYKEAKAILAGTIHASSNVAGSAMSRVSALEPQVARLAAVQETHAVAINGSLWVGLLALGGTMVTGGLLLLSAVYSSGQSSGVDMARSHQIFDGTPKL